MIKEKIGVEGCNPSPSTTCEEASILSTNFYVPCGKPTVKSVYHRRDNKSYAMCVVCADHNIRNRGGLEVV